MAYPAVDKNITMKDLRSMVLNGNLHPTAILPYYMLEYGKGTGEEFQLYFDKVDCPKSPDEWTQFIFDSIRYGYKKTKKVFFPVSVTEQRTDVLIQFASTSSRYFRGERYDKVSSKALFVD
jgi:hypothetical protein